MGPEHGGERSVEGGSDAAEVEQHRLVVAVAREDRAPLVIATQVAHHHGRRASFQALVADGEWPLVISDVEIAMPENGWELRTSGLWADHICETPFEHWSYGLEAFALAIDDPRELLGRGFGDRVPLGWELEFEASDEPEIDADLDRQLGVAHGLVLFATGEVEIDGRALRSHRRGAASFGAEVVLADGSATDRRRELEADLDGPGGAGSMDYDVEVALPGIDEIWWVARTRAGVRTRTDYSSR